MRPAGHQEGAVMVSMRVSMATLQPVGEDVNR